MVSWVQSKASICSVWWFPEHTYIDILILYASHVMYQLMVADQLPLARLALAIVGGVGLAAVWIASAYVLYVLLT